MSHGLSATWAPNGQYMTPYSHIHQAQNEAVETRIGNCSQQASITYDPSESVTAVPTVQLTNNIEQTLRLVFVRERGDGW